MAESKWPSLSFHNPEDISDHAACLQEDFDAVFKYLQSDKSKKVPRYLFTILYKSFSRLSAKVHAKVDDSDVDRGSSAAKSDGQEEEAPEAGHCDKDSKGQELGEQQPTMGRSQQGQSDHKQDRGREKALRKKEDAQRVIAASPGSIHLNPDVHHENTENNPTPLELESQNLELLRNLPCGPGPLGHIVLKAMMANLSKMGFNYFFEIDPTSFANQASRESLIRFFIDIPQVEKRLTACVAINEASASACAYNQGLGIFEVEITSKSKLVTFVSNSQGCTQLAAAEHWKSALPVCAVIALQKSDFRALSEVDLTNLPQGILNIIVERPKPNEKQDQEPTIIQSKPSLEVQIPREIAQKHVKNTRPAHLLGTIRNAAEDDHPKLDAMWITSAKPTHSGNVTIQLSSHEALNALQLNKRWKTDFRIRLNPPVFKVVMMNVSTSSMPNLGSNKTRSRVLRNLTDQNFYGQKLIRSICQVVQMPTPNLSSVVLAFRKREQANLALKEGLLWDSVRHECIRFVDDMFVEQCCRCQAYEHDEIECPREVRCGNCAKNHATGSCDSSSRKCVLCGGPHASTDYKCPLRSTWKSEAQRTLSLKSPFISGRGSLEPGDNGTRSNLSASTKAQQETTAGQSGESKIDSAHNNPIPAPSREDRTFIKPEPNSTPLTTPKRKASEPLSTISGNIKPNKRAKGIKKEDIEENPVQQYIREKGAIPWPPPKQQRIKDTTKTQSRRQRSRRSKRF